jgi:hypothetical protein
MTKKMKSNGDAADVDRLVSDKVSEVLPMYLPCRLMRSVGMNGLKTRGPSDVTVLSPSHTHTLSLSYSSPGTRVHSLPTDHSSPLSFDRVRDAGIIRRCSTRRRSGVRSHWGRSSSSSVLARVLVEVQRL